MKHLLFIGTMKSVAVCSILLTLGQIVSAENSTDSRCLQLKNSCLNFQCDRICEEGSLFACKSYCDCKIGSNALNELGYTCKENCSNHHDLCQVECNPGFHGQHCSLQCNTGCRNQLCYHGTGYCRGCENGRYGQTCLDQCNRNCLYNLCDQSSGGCMFGCQHGFYGPSCDEECLGCYVCSPDTGECLIEDGPIYESNTNECVIISSSSIGGISVIMLSLVVLYRCCRSTKNKRSGVRKRRPTRPPMDLPPITQRQNTGPHYDVIMERIARLETRSMTSLDERTDSNTTRYKTGYSSRKSKRSFLRNLKSLSTTVDNLPSCWVGGQGIFDLFDTIPEGGADGNTIRLQTIDRKVVSPSRSTTNQDTVCIADTSSSFVGNDGDDVVDDADADDITFDGAENRRKQKCINLRTSMNTYVTIHEDPGVLESHVTLSQETGSEKSCVRKGYISAVFDQSMAVDQPRDTKLSSCS